LPQLGDVPCISDILGARPCIKKPAAGWLSEVDIWWIYWILMGYLMEDLLNYGFHGIISDFLQWINTD